MTTKFNVSSLIGFLYNLEYQVKIPLYLGINNISTEYLFENSNFQFLKNSQFILFKLNVLSENKASLRTYDGLYLTVRVSEDDNSEEVKVNKNGIKTLNTLNNLEIAVLNYVYNFGTFKFFRENLEFNSILRSAKQLDIIDLCSINSTDEMSHSRKGFDNNENNIENINYFNNLKFNLAELPNLSERKSENPENSEYIYKDLDEKVNTLLENSENIVEKEKKLTDESLKILISENFETIIIPKIFLNLEKYDETKFLRKRKKISNENDSISNIEVNMNSPITSDFNPPSKSNNCTICFESIKIPSRIGCDHIFCKECIDQWSNMSSTCPLCKIEFKKIIYFNENNKIINQRKVKKRKFKYEEDENENWIENCLEHCMKCKQANDVYLMLVCDKCKYNVCHTYCAGLDKIPDEDWFCENCNGNKDNLLKNEKKLVYKKRRTQIITRKFQYEDSNFKSNKIIKNVKKITKLNKDDNLILIRNKSNQKIVQKKNIK